MHPVRPADRLASAAASVSWRAAAGVAGIGLYVALLAAAMELTTYNVWGALVVVPVLVAVHVPVLQAVARREPDPWFGRLIVAAFVLKLLGGLLRYWVAFVLYDGVADASGYAAYATRVAGWWRQGVFAVDVPTGDQLVGTAFVRLLTAGVFTVTGPTTLGGFAVFSILGFWGLYLAYRAFRVGFPEGDHRRYALLVFLLPSLLFWPSSIGKEAWLSLCIGAIALGAAKLYTRAHGAVPLLVVGLLGSAMVRPHVTALAVAGLLVGQVFRPRGRTAFGLVSKVASVVVIVVVAGLVVQRAAAFLGIDDLTAEGVSEAITWAGGQTAQGGSEFDAVPLTSPLGVPLAVVSVLFRPFPWEAHNLQALVASLESVVVLAVIAGSWRRLRALPRLLRTRPYLIFAATYVLLFIYAFSSFGNFGILARQRVLVLPFVLIAAALPAGGRRDGVVPGVGKETVHVPEP